MFLANNFKNVISIYIKNKFVLVYVFFHIIKVLIKIFISWIIFCEDDISSGKTMVFSHC